MELLKKIILENQEFIKKRKILPRNIHIPETENIIVFAGIRRCGKTSLLYYEAKKLALADILFLDFEDERLVFLNTLENYDLILDSYLELFPNRRPILFFDEVQGLKNWHLYVKRLYAKGFKIYITGSNANLLSKEIATFLTGRAVEIRVFPFSFQEFLHYKKIGFSEKERLLNKPLLLVAFNEYLTFGGMPEVIKTAPNDKILVLKSIYTLLFYKDLIARYDKKELLMRLIISKIVENITKPFSISNLANKIQPLYKTNRQTVTDYFQLLHIPFIIESIYQYRKSFVKRENERKTYLADTGFIRLVSIKEDYGKLLENLVFSYLKRKFDVVYYYKTSNNLEIDFLIIENNNPHLFQVSYDISDNMTREREIKALIKGMRELGLQQATLITNDEKDSLFIHNFRIDIKPFWEIALTKKE